MMMCRTRRNVSLKFDMMDGSLYLSHVMMRRGAVATDTAVLYAMYLSRPHPSLSRTDRLSVLSRRERRIAEAVQAEAFCTSRINHRKMSRTAVLYS